MADIYHITLPSTISYIGRYAFMAAWFSEITIPAGCTISHHAFENCQMLTNITIGANCVINIDAFVLCNNTKIVTAGENIEYKDMVFGELKNIELIYTGQTDPTDENTIKNYKQIASKVKVPCEYASTTFCGINAIKQDGCT